MINLIVARSINNVIGKDGKIPWKIKGEQKQFKELTTGKTVIMGRRTYEEIGHPLPNRKNIVVSKTIMIEDENLTTVSNLQKAIKLAGDDEVFIIGGYRLFKESLYLVNKMYITEVQTIIEDGDTFFPDFNPNDFDIIIGETIGDEIKYKRTLYIRKNQ